MSPAHTVAIALPRLMVSSLRVPGLFSRLFLLLRIAAPYHRKPRPDSYPCMLKQDPSIQPETLARMFW
jgi:hypothetical protein